MTFSIVDKILVLLMGLFFGFGLGAYAFGGEARILTISVILGSGCAILSAVRRARDEDGEPVAGIARQEKSD